MLSGLNQNGNRVGSEVADSSDMSIKTLGAEEKPKSVVLFL
jgi:hypothetical protein